MITPFACLLAVAAAVAADGPSLAAIEFTPPPSFRAAEARSPALWEGVYLEGSVEHARMILFVVPAPAGATNGERVDRALEVAALYARPLAEATTEAENDDASIHLREVERTSGLETVRLVLARLEGRTAGLVLSGLADDVEALAAEQRASAASIRASVRIHPPDAGALIEHARLGFAYRAPVGFLPDGPRDASTPPRFALPPHLGIVADVEVTVLDSFQDRSIDAAADALREALILDGAVRDATQARLGPLPAWRFDHEASDGRRHLLHLVELHGRRLLLAFAAPTEHFDRLLPAFTESAASFVAVERVVSVALEERVDDAAVGFSMRPPLGFLSEASGVAATTRTFAEFERIEPRNRLVVRRLDAPFDHTDLDACVEWTRARAAGADGWTAVRAVRPLLLNGRRGARVQLAGEGRAQERWTVATKSGVYEIAFDSRADERALYLPSVEAAVRTFQPRPPSSGEGLADAIEGPGERVVLRPPRGWTERARSDGVVRIGEDAPGGAWLEVRISAPPADARLEAVSDQIRAGLVERLTATGGAPVRVDDATAEVVRGRPEVRLRLAYRHEDRPVRALHRAIVERERVVHAHAVADEAAFTERAALLRAALASVEIEPPPGPR